MKRVALITSVRSWFNFLINLYTTNAVIINVNCVFSKQIDEMVWEVFPFRTNMERYHFRFYPNSPGYPPFSSCICFDEDRWRRKLTCKQVRQTDERNAFLQKFDCFDQDVTIEQEGNYHLMGVENAR